MTFVSKKLHVKQFVSGERIVLIEHPSEYIPVVRIQSSQILSSEEIEVPLMERSTQINSLLNHSPCILMHSGAPNTDRITIRGIGNRSPFSTTGLRAFIDGIPLINGVGETSIEDIDLGIIDKMNIYKGPTSSLRGAALGGMIDMKTRVIKNGDDPLAEHRKSHSSFGGRSFQTYLNSNIGHNNHILVGHAHYHSDGYRDNNEYDRHNKSLIGKHNSAKFLLSGIALFTGVKAFILGSLNETDYISHPQLAASNWQAVKGNEDYQKYLFGLNAKVPLTYRTSLEASTYLGFFDQREIRPFNTLEDDSGYAGGRVRLNYALSRQSLDINVGGDFFYEKYDRKTLAHQSQQAPLIEQYVDRRTVINTFSEIEYGPLYGSASRRYLPSISVMVPMSLLSPLSKYMLAPMSGEPPGPVTVPLILTGDPIKKLVNNPRTMSVKKMCFFMTIIFV